MGFETKEIKIEKDEIVVALSIHEGKLEEVAVVSTGYWQTTRKLSTGNIGTVTGKEINKNAIINPLQALEGRTPGLLVTQTGGITGSQIKVEIRGISSLSASPNNKSNFFTSNDPLFVIDGVPFAANNNSQLHQQMATSIFGTSGGINPLSLINAADIEKVEILKDADATSIYGSRGANGVILITTTKAKAGISSLDISLSAGVNRVGRGAELLNTEEFREIRKNTFLSDGIVPSPVPGPGYSVDLFIFDSTKYTDFKKYFIGNSSGMSNVQLNLSGGNTNTKYSLSGGYNRQSSLFPIDNLNYKRGSLHLSVSHNSDNRRLHIGVQTLYSAEANNLVQQDPTQITFLPPNYPSFFDSANNLVWEYKGAVLENPFAAMYRSFETKANNFSTNISLRYLVFKGLSLKTNAGINTYQTEQYLGYPLKSTNPNNGEVNYAQFANTRSGNWIVEPQLEYKTTGKYGDIILLAGGTFQQTKAVQQFMSGRNFLTDALLRNINAAAAGSVVATNGLQEYNYISGYGRLNYSLKETYLVNITARRDGSSRFGPDKRFANFGAVGLAWIFTNDILKNKAILSSGKLRTSYGTSGNDKIGDYNYLNTWSIGSGYQGVNTIFPSALYNPGFEWEINKKFEVAMELQFLENRIGFLLTWYNNRSGNQLISYKLPTQAGFVSVISNLPAVIQNRGAEAEINAAVIKAGNFSWNSSFNITLPSNTLVAFPNIETSSYANSFVIGESVSTIRGLRYLGLDSLKGIYLFEDKNKDGKLGFEDYETLGKADPTLYGGLNNSFTYKNLSLSFFFSFRKQTGLTYLHYFTTPGYGYSNLPKQILGNYWEKPGDQKQWQRLTQNEGSEAFAAAQVMQTQPNSAKYGDASFIRLKNVFISYSLPVKMLEKIRFKRLNVFVQGQNLLLFTKYQGADPETLNYMGMPVPKTFTAGINATL